MKADTSSFDPAHAGRLVNMASWPDSPTHSLDTSAPRGLPRNPGTTSRIDGGTTIPGDFVPERPT